MAPETTAEQLDCAETDDTRGPGSPLALWSETKRNNKPNTTMVEQDAKSRTRPSPPSFRFKLDKRQWAGCSCKTSVANFAHRFHNEATHREG